MVILKGMNIVTTELVFLFKKEKSKIFLKKRNLSNHHRLRMFSKSTKSKNYTTSTRNGITNENL
ncbi:hypothetical protein E0Z07_11980 [Myroides odoratimimus]|nr:hypothetical protein E0Z07_11980 [Myroides odoratimimus]